MHVHGPYVSYNNFLLVPYRISTATILSFRKKCVHDMSIHLFLAGLSHQVCPPALLFRLGSRKVRRYKNTWIRNSSDAMAQQEWKVVRRRRSSEGCSTSPNLYAITPSFQTCQPPPWQERLLRARTFPPGGWSSPARRTCRQVCVTHNVTTGPGHKYY